MMLGSLSYPPSLSSDSNPMSEKGSFDKGGIKESVFRGKDKTRVFKGAEMPVSGLRLVYRCPGM
jgi:hypothetical protein